MMKVKDFVYDVFLRLTSKTCPYGYEDQFLESMQMIFPTLQKDTHGNYFYKVGESRTIFASHLDTVSKDYTPVVHVFNGKMVGTDGKTTLGADDKAGVTIMLWMIQNNVPGLYYFFVGEEVGCIGSGLAAKYGDFKGKYDRIISFDRKGLNSVITYQSSQRSCSDKFADDLCKELNRTGLKYQKDDTGVYTDSAEFMDIIPECTNISVGYYQEHTVRESQDLYHLVELASACVKVDWESLSTKRNPSVSDYKSWSSQKSYSSRFDYETNYDYENQWYGSRNRKRRRNKSKTNDHRKSYGYYDDWYDQNQSFVSESKTKDEPKSYYSSGSELMEIKYKSNDNNSNKYDWILHKFAKEQMTLEELEFVKENYLDMNTDYDKFFYDYLKEISF